MTEEQSVLRYKMRPPVLNVQVEDSMDIMIVRDTTRRAASLLGFSPAYRAQLATAAASLAELVLKTGEAHTLNLNGVIGQMNKFVCHIVVTELFAASPHVAILIKVAFKTAAY